MTWENGKIGATVLVERQTEKWEQKGENLGWKTQITGNLTDTFDTHRGLSQSENNKCI